MNTTLSRISDAERDRAMRRAQERKPLLRINERGDGFVRATVNCEGTCGYHELNDGVHDVVIWHDGRLTCSCVATLGLCYHLAALLAHELGALPDPPVTCEARGCGGALFYEWGGNGHAPTCHQWGDETSYYPRSTEGVAARVAERAKAIALREPTPIVGGRQRAINRTRPTLSVVDDRVVVAYGCGHEAWSVRRDALAEGTGRWFLPLSPMEGCPACADHMFPPAPDRAAARREGV